MTDDRRQEAERVAHYGNMQRAKVLRLELARLQPFVVEPDRPLSFSDLQAAFAADVVTGRRVAAVLAEAQLIRRVPPPRGARPTYLFEKPLIRLLAPRRRACPSRGEALRIACAALEAITEWNVQGRAARLVGFAVTGGLLDPKAAAVDGVAVVITVRVRRASTLAQELAGLLGCLRDVAAEYINESLVLEVQ